MKNLPFKSPSNHSLLNSHYIESYNNRKLTFEIFDMQPRFLHMRLRLTVLTLRIPWHNTSTRPWEISNRFKCTVSFTEPLNQSFPQLGFQLFYLIEAFKVALIYSTSQLLHRQRTFTALNHPINYFVYSLAIQFRGHFYVK